MVTINYFPRNVFYYIASINIVKINYESLTVPIQLDKNKNTHKTHNRLVLQHLALKALSNYFLWPQADFSTCHDMSDSCN